MTARNFVSRNPATGEIVKEFKFISDEELEVKIQNAHKAFEAYRKLDVKARRERLVKMAQILETNKQQYATIMMEEMGKPIKSSIQEIEGCAQLVRYHADNLERLTAPEISKCKDGEMRIVMQPLGVIYSITPFNYPFFVPFMGIIGIIAMGNTIIHRPSDSTPRCGLAIEELFQKAGFTANEFQNVFTSQQQLEYVLSHKLVHGVEFTGSVRAGSQIAAMAGKYLKKAVMELGGNDPFIVLKDADIDATAKIAAHSRCVNTGQMCCSPKRFIVEAAVYDKFLSKLVEELKSIKVGDPREEDTEVGPCARVDLYENVKRQFEQAVKEGARLVFDYGELQGEKFKVNGSYFTPKILEITDRKNIVMREEVFGPLLCVCKVANEDEALELANDTQFGLSSSVFTKSSEKARKFIDGLEAGVVNVNECNHIEPGLPFGGVKASGHGRTMGPLGIKEFANFKSVFVK